MYKEKVSVIIPTYNRANTIKRAIDSVLGQTYEIFELIVVDDGSTDDTYQIVGGYEDSRVRYFRIEERHGANHARNIGIQNATGNYIAFQDSDDFWLQGKLEKQMNIFEQYPQVGVVWCPYFRVTLSGTKRRVPEVYMKNRSQTELEKELAVRNVIGTPTMVVRKECFEKVGIFDEAIQRFQDWELCIRLVQQFQFYFIDEVLVEAYESETGITNVNSAMDSQLFLVTKHYDFFEKAGSMELRIARLLELSVEEDRLEDLLESLDESLFLRGIYAHVKRSMNMSKNHSFFREWMQKNNIEMIINHFFVRFPEHSIMIYGMGEIGRLLLNSMSEQSKKRIAFIIDKNTNVLAEYKVITLAQLRGLVEKSIECIIITAIAYEEEIRKDLEQITTVSVVSLYDIIRENI